METHTPEIHETHHAKKPEEGFFEKYSTPLSILGAGIFVAIALTGGGTRSSREVTSVPATTSTQTALEEAVLPTEGVTLPITWGDLGAKMVEVGAIDPAK